MYIRQEHEFLDPEALCALIEAHPLGAWVFQGESGLLANHLPFFLDRERGPHGTLIAHVSRANPAWRELAAGRASVVMFQGPQAYITPGWYPSKAANGRVVPTWNYVVAHVHGVAHAVDDPVWMEALLNRLVNTHESREAHPWHMQDAPADYIARMMRAVVGIEIPMDRLQGKLKASQDEDREDRVGTVAGLRARGREGDRAMAMWVASAMD